MHNTFLHCKRLTAALVWVAALGLAASVLTVAPSNAAGSGGTRVASRTARVAPAAARGNVVTARAGRAGPTLRTIFVRVGAVSPAPATAGHPRATVQQLRSGRWRTVAVTVLRRLDGRRVGVTWQSRKAATLRVSVPKLGLVTPSMKVPAAPKSTKSRYYVRSAQAGGDGAVLRVFKGGIAYGIDASRRGSSCLAGRLDRHWLKLRVNGGTKSVKYRTSGSWRRLQIHDGAAQVGAPRTSLVGRNLRRFQRCAAPTYASVTTRSSSRYPWHTNIVATTFWVGEIFDPNAEDGSQRVSTYDSNWFAHYGGCDGVVRKGLCSTEARTAAKGYFPTSMTPKQNPFYLDLPFDDLNDEQAFARRSSVIPWARDRGYAGHETDRSFSYMKNRWVQITKGAKTCFGQIEDAGPGQYNDAEYVFGRSGTRPLNERFNGAGMDVSPALNGCLGFDEINGEDDRVNWRFVDADDVPRGPWRTLVTSSPVSQ